MAPIIVDDFLIYCYSSHIFLFVKHITFCRKTYTFLIIIYEDYLIENLSL